MATIRKNARPQACERCGTHVAEQQGTLLRAASGAWQVVCQGCLPWPVAAPPRIRVLPHTRGAELQPAEYLGGDMFARYRAAQGAVCRSRQVAGQWQTTVALADLPELIERLRAAGFAPELAAELQASIAGEAARIDAERSAAAARAGDVDAALRSAGGALYAYQPAGIRWLAPRTQALLADDMGLGKTLQALLAAPAGAPILVICPAVAKGVWVREAAKWRPDLVPVALSGRGSFRWPQGGEMVVINYDILPGKVAGTGRAQAVELPADLGLPEPGTVVIADEAHALKSSKAQRTAKFRHLAHQARQAGGRTWLLTGTPLLNRPPELWALLAALGAASSTFGSWAVFTDRMGGYKTRWGTEWDPAGIDREWAQQRLAGVMLRRLKADVLTDLPERRHERLEVNGLSAATLRACDAALAALAAAGLDVEDALRKADAAAHTAQAKVAFERLSAARAALAVAKVPAAVELVESYEEEGEPVVVFSAHRAPVDALATREGWAAITGDTPAEQRSEIERRFQSGELRGVAATIQAGGVAITLTRASHCVFVDRLFTPALNSQAEDRIYRIGQTRGVLVRDLVAAHALDRRLAVLLAAKTETVNAAVDTSAVDAAADPDAEAAADLRALLGRADLAGAPVPTDSDYAARVEVLARELDALSAQRLVVESARRRGVLAPEPAVSAPDHVRRARGVGHPSDPAYLPEALQPRAARSAQEEWAARGLAFLAGNDPDHAGERNDVGFNRFDQTVGHSLAARVAGGLSDAGWRLAIAVCKKYHRQIGKCPTESAPPSE